MVIGGATIYQQFLKQTDRLYLTFIDLEVAGDTLFPDYQADANWSEMSRESHSADAENRYNYQFVILESC